MAWNYSAKEFIKVYRKFMDWEWYTNTNTKSLFIHCLLKANWKATEWNGVQLEAGQFITSLPKLSEETGLSIQQVKTALDHLILTGDIESSVTGKTAGTLTATLTGTLTGASTGKKLNRGRIITVVNWDSYQNSNSQNNSQVNSHLNSQNNSHINSRYKNIYKNNIKNIKELSLGECAFEKPTLEAVKRYCQEQGFTATVPEEFFDFYESKDWTIGKDKMKDWKASLRGWERRKLKKNEQNKSKSKSAFTNFEQHDTDYAELERQLDRQFAEMTD